MNPINAPWTPAQVAALLRWQRCEHAHPYTAADGRTLLIPTVDGWTMRTGGPVVDRWASRAALHYTGCASGAFPSYVCDPCRRSALAG